MKRLLFFMTALACILAVTGCNKEPNEGSSDANGQTYFNAAVLELSDGSVKGTCTEPFDSGISVGAEFLVSTDTVEAAGAPELAIGDDIRVVFDGRVMESDPLQLGTVFAIYLLDDNGEVIPNK